MQFTLSTAAEYLRTSKATTAFLSFLAQIRRVFTFPVERANRLRRFLRIIEDYRKGKPVRDIETKFGCSRGTILRYARLSGEPKRPRTDDPERRATIIAMSKQHPRPSQTEISKACKCSIALVSLVEHEAGIKRYRGSGRDRSRSQI